MTTAPIRTHYEHLYIDGRWQMPGAGLDTVISPVTEEPLGHAPLGDATNLEAALAAARAAFDRGPWPDESREYRATLMQQLFDRIVARREEALGLMQLEMGFTRMQCDMQLELLFTQMTRFIELTRQDPLKSLKMMTRQQPDGRKSFGGAVTTRDPVGVVSAITPYNSGFLLGLMKAVPAMANGNTVVPKPSPYTPLQTLLIAELVAELDLPPGVFNIVTGGPEVGQRMSSDPRVDMVTFTGSDAVGAQVMAQASPTLKKVHLELGGKSPLIVRHDANLEKAAMAGVFGFVFQAGQGCSMTTRMLVDNRILVTVQGNADAEAKLAYARAIDIDRLTGR